MAVKFCFLLGKTSADTVVKLKLAYKNDYVGETFRSVNNGFIVSKIVKLKQTTNLFMNIVISL